MSMVRVVYAVGRAMMYFFGRGGVGHYTQLILREKRWDDLGVVDGR
jgi:hypothetical protein